MNYSRAFTIIELIITISIVAVLSGIILFSTVQYINKGKDSNIYGNLAVLVPAGEAYYNKSNSYEGFCGSTVVANAFSQMPPGTANQNCAVEGPDSQAWAACVRRFVDNSMAYCVDSRGIKKEIPDGNCTNQITECPE